MSNGPALNGGEAAIRSQAARTLVKLFDSLYEGALVVDRQARIVWINDKFKALLGWNGVEAIEGRPVDEVIPDSQMRRVVETGQADLLDVYLVNNRQLVVSRIPLLDEDGAVTGALGVILYDRLQALRPLFSKFQRLQQDLETARRELAEGRRAKYGFSQFIGTSRAARDLKAEARRAAERDATVLLLGETGTGKELLAHAIHAGSARAGGPMVRVNAAAIPETLLEAELFGTAPGAFTGAASRPRPGKVQLAHGGTLFLDEIGDLPLFVQAKLLRVLEEREVEPLGSNAVIPVDVRIIAATSRDLRAMVAEDRFRADLYYRLNVLPLNLPPLRERLQDLGPLCEALLERITAEQGAPVVEVAPDGLDRLAAYHWPGNVRELFNVLQQALARDERGPLTARHFDGLLPAVPVGRTVPMAAAPGTAEPQPGRAPAAEQLAARTTPALPPSAPATPSDAAALTYADAVRPLRDVLAEVERAALIGALAATGGVKVRAARLLGISRAQFYEKLYSYHLLSGISDDQANVLLSRH